jgi:SAM-dependent methyltransferase
MPAEFDRHGADYETTVDRAIAFAGQPHDVYLEAKAHKLLELLRRRLGSERVSVLDVGCGPGLVARHLSGRVSALHGVDVSEAMVERAREAVPDGEFQVSEPGRLPHEDARFDLTYAVCVLHHVPRGERPALLSEMRRVTRPGGLVVVFEHNPWNPLTRRVVRACDLDEGVELLTRREVVAGLRGAGLEVTDAEYLLFSPWRGARVERLERGLARVPLGAQYVVAGRVPSKPAERAADWDAQWRGEPLDPAAARAEERTPRWRAQEALVRERFGSFKGLKVVELGSGRGLNGILHASRGAEVTLVDTSRLALEQAAELFAAFGVEPGTVEADVFALPTDLLGRFDVAMSFGLCEHFLGERRLAAIKAHLELVRPGGLALLGVPNRRAPAYRLWLATLKRRGTWPLGTEEPFSEPELAALARSAGGQPLEPVYGSFVASLVDHGVNQALYKFGGRGVGLPQIRVPLLDRFAYELLLPVVRP